MNLIRYTHRLIDNFHSIYLEYFFRYYISSIILLSLELNLSCDDNDLTNMQSFGIHLDPALYKRSEENTELLTKSTQKVLEFIYPTSRFN